MITGNEILDFVNNHFSGGRQDLVPLLKNYLRHGSVSNEIHEALRIAMAGRAYKCDYLGMNHTRADRLRDDDFDIEDLGDTSDYYFFYLNKELESFPIINGKEELNFKSYQKQGNETHTCRLWVNWFLPIYYLELEYKLLPFPENEWIVQEGPVQLSDPFELDVVEKIQAVLSNFNYQPLSKSFLLTKGKDWTSDVRYGDADLFDCLFADMNRPTQHLIMNLEPIKIPFDDQIEYSFTEYLNDDRTTKSKIRRIHHKGERNSTSRIISNTANEVTEFNWLGFKGKDWLEQKFTI